MMPMFAISSLSIIFTPPDDDADDDAAKAPFHAAYFFVTPLMMPLRYAMLLYAP